jgi:hypothetical protein
MPRRSSADLNIVRLPGRGRPAPPRSLSQTEQQTWRAIVDSSPGGFLDGAAQVVLRRVITQVSIAERHEERLRRIAESGGDLESELEIAGAHREASKAIISGLTALRATPRSRMESRDARNTFKHSPRGRRPWDIEAKVVKSDRAPELDETDHGEAPT